MSEQTDSSDDQQTDPDEVIAQTLSVQSEALASLADSDTTDQIRRVARIVDELDGRAVFTGVGKSGDVAKKIVATFNSIGVPSHFLHPVEALHGDLGSISDNDIVFLISNSGNTDEMCDLLQYLTSLHMTTVAITSDPESTLGQNAEYHINTHIDEEGAVVELVPMASATVTMVVGDCLANALMALRNFDKQKFGHFHPGGTIGKRLLLDVEDLLYSDIPATHPSDTLAEVALKTSDGGKGIAVVQNDEGVVLGVLTDGDIRRLLEDGVDMHDVVAEEVMVTDPITVSPNTSAIEALEIIEEHSITQLLATDDEGHFEGIVHIHDIMQTGLSSSEES
ncbi:KpsF/GutQ family sugar-phosphate isomerase [Halomicrobium sp. IBSBa]|uniref:KpsF/GutQ family sugar-phosphate isomerase n=1 Tax=Halomicrobium sp. IBSBa TaxID=2778916 RepID=UPI001ABFF95D|nr:KpsF/GutQ family sugar-phosphate isomerase [Halomicrobium sp. IBSBa]MBO4247099.1 KpsF/GutQ family sugar-phosphate isomerase [Halomicrobium sp. IBSBa]